MSTTRFLSSIIIIPPFLACRGSWHRVGQRRIDRAVCSALERQRGRSTDRRCWSDSGYLASHLLHIVRVDLAHCLGFSKLIEREVILARIVPCVRDLSHDTSQHVRAALANQISGLAPLLGREATVEHLLPLFLHLLKDEFPEVRLNVISKLETVNGGMKNNTCWHSNLIHISYSHRHRAPVG